jgi:hypothetical protein
MLNLKSLVWLLQKNLVEDIQRRESRSGIRLVCKNADSCCQTLSWSLLTLWM